MSKVRCAFRRLRSRWGGNGGLDVSKYVPSVEVLTGGVPQMANYTVLTEPGATKMPGQPRQRGEAVGGPGFDWLMSALGTWLLGGLYLDGWAHIHVPGLETFFTPWHAVLYSGYLAGAMALLVTCVRNRRRGPPRSRAVPDGYELSLVGALGFFFAGMSYIVWTMTIRL